MLQSMGSQRVRHDLAPEQAQQNKISKIGTGKSEGQVSKNLLSVG